MTAEILPQPTRQDRNITAAAAAERIGARGHIAFYRLDEVNHCPGCGRSHWHVGRVSAECAFCGTALPFATATYTSSPGKDV